IGVLLRGVIGIFFAADERILRDARAQPSLSTVEDRDPYAQCAEIYARNNAHMSHEILLAKNKQRVPCRHRHQLLSITQKTDWIRLHGAARGKSPKRLARGRIQSEEMPFIGPSED